MYLRVGEGVPSSRYNASMLQEYTTGRYFRKRQWEINRQSKQARYTEEKEKQPTVDPATAIADAGQSSPVSPEFIRVAF
jgi:hypothetical protein